MTSSLFRRTLMASALGLVSLSAYANATNRFDVSDMWQVAEMKQGSAKLCEVTNEYDNGFGVTFMLNNGSVTQLSIDMKQDIFDKGEGYNASFSVDGKNIGNQTGGAKDAQTLSFDMTGFDGLRTSLSRGQELGVNVEQNPFAFSLKHFDEALAKNVVCENNNSTPMAAPIQAASNEAIAPKSAPVQMDLFERDASIANDAAMHGNTLIGAADLKEREIYVRRQRSNATPMPDVGVDVMATTLSSVAPAAGDEGDAQVGSVPEITSDVFVKREPEPIDLLRSDIATEAQGGRVLVSRMDQSMVANSDQNRSEQRPEEMAMFEGGTQRVTSMKSQISAPSLGEVAASVPASVSVPVITASVTPAPSQDRLNKPSVDVPVRTLPPVNSVPIAPQQNVVSVAQPAPSHAQAKQQATNTVDVTPYEPIKTPMPYAPIVSGAALVQPAKEPQIDESTSQIPVVASTPLVQPAPQFMGHSAAQLQPMVVVPDAVVAPVMVNADRIASPVEDDFLSKAITAAKAQQDEVIRQPLPPMNVVPSVVQAHAPMAPIVVNTPSLPNAIATPITNGMRIATPKAAAPEVTPIMGVQAAQQNAVVEKLYRLENGGATPVHPRAIKLAAVQDVLDASTMSEIPIRVVRSDDIFVSRPVEASIDSVNDTAPQAVEVNEPTAPIAPLVAQKIEPTLSKATQGAKSQQHALQNTEPQKLQSQKQQSQEVPKISRRVSLAQDDGTVLDSKPITVAKQEVSKQEPDVKNAMKKWTAKSGESMKDVLARWADIADMDLRWEADSDTKLSQDIDVNGDVQAAVQLLLAQNKNEAGLQGDFVIDGDDDVKKSEAAPVQLVSATKAPEPLPWQAQKGGSLRQTLESWSMRENVKVIWKADRDFLISNAPIQTQAYDEAIASVLQQYTKDPVRPVGHLNIDPATNQKLLVIDVERVL